MTLRYLDMNQHDALYKAAREYPGGVEALAQRMGISKAVLYNKLRPSINTHYVSFEEVSEIIELCQECNVPDAIAPLSALNWRHGLVTFEVPGLHEMTDVEIASSIGGAMKEFGDVAGFLSQKMASKTLSLADQDRFQLEFKEAFAALAQLHARAEAHFKMLAGE